MEQLFKLDEAIQIAEKIGYPVLVRPSFVLWWKRYENCLLN